VKIAPLQPADAPSLSAFFAKILLDLPYYNERAQAAEREKYSTNGLRKLIRRDPGSILVAKTRSRLVGYCFSSHDDSLVWMAWIAVHPDCRRTKIASTLIQALEARARRLGSHKIWCDCRTENEVSKSMLLHNQFRQICVVRNHWFEQDFILWEKSIGR
jgi:ribosomal protein S18 acetylase RimI-like enzyme